MHMMEQSKKEENMERSEGNTSASAVGTTLGEEPVREETTLGEEPVREEGTSVGNTSAVGTTLGEEPVREEGTSVGNAPVGNTPGELEHILRIRFDDLKKQRRELQKLVPKIGDSARRIEVQDYLDSMNPCVQGT
ncbi:unnamed protein product [Arabis nemorensis]|uniref:Uncharacterized protein n=1 Tax=Arabis nemorensis TaxID=586526 RepID=A0A565BZT4_9BRAS|nr:unnamed protein product [Arabis nemorensis]